MKSPNNSRREMLKKGLLAASGLTFWSTAQSSTTPTTNEVPSLEKQVAFVTGAARGIGRATAIELAKKGVKVAICDIDKQIGSVQYPLSTAEDLQETKQLIESAGGTCLSFIADVRDRGEMQKVVKQTVNRWGRLDILVANAGIVTISPLEQMSPEAWQDVIDVNLTGVAWCMQAVIPHMRKQKYGRIINIASVNGRQASAGIASYNSSKWGLIGLTKGIAQEVGNDHITVNAICPTGVYTGIFDNDFSKKLMSPENPTREGQEKGMREFHTLPVGFLKSKDIADSVLFLCSPEAKYISGTTIDVAAGGTAKILHKKA